MTLMWHPLPGVAGERLAAGIPLAVLETWGERLGAPNAQTVARRVWRHCVLGFR